MRTDCRSDGYNTEVGVHSECDVKHLADDVSSTGGFQGHLTETEAATYCVGRFVNKQTFRAFPIKKEKKENLILGNEFLKVSLRSPTSCFREAQFEHRLSQRLRF